MLADFFTKPVQGTLFRKLRDRIMNIDPSSPYHSDHRSVLDESELKEGKQNELTTDSAEENTDIEVGRMSYRDAVVKKG